MFFSREPRSALPVLSRLLLVVLAATMTVALAAAPSTAAYPTLRNGSTGPGVTALQYLLTARGYATTADGDYGSGTQSAVTAFQSGAGLTADGIAGPATLGAIVVTVQQGAQSPAVQAAQVLLNSAGSSLSTDGAFGPATASAVKSFQSAHGLSADGVVGPNTWSALFGAAGGSGSTPGTTYDSLSPQQIANARTIIGVGKGAAIPEYGWVVALATSMQESTLLNIDYGDRDSLGLFQQRTSQGWGTTSQILDPVLSSKAFYGVATHTSNPGLVDISGWQSKSVTVDAQAVQRSCCPDAYAKWEGLARDIVAHEGGAPAID